jgi:DNA-binding NtrC family response regulator
MTPIEGRILVADDEPSILSFVKKSLSDEGYTVFTASNGKEACETADREQVHLALLDLIMPNMTGLEALKQIKEQNPDTRVMIMTAFATAETAVEAMRQGALDYLIKPFSLEEMKMHVRRALSEMALVRDNLALKREVERRTGTPEITGESPAIREVLGMVARISGTMATVLVQGESGTGKELVARALHANSPRKDGPFIAINCGAIPETLLERELFGHEKGAFTGAEKMSPGLLEAASEGTILLDEIGDMPPALQVKLLRVLEGHEYMRVGGTRPQKSRVRFLASTNKDLRHAVDQKQFREDLYYRLNVVSIKLPPLRERGGDILLLADRFLGRFAGERGRSGLAFSEPAKTIMKEYRWPGNVRELQNVVERAVLLCNGDRIGAADLALAPPAAAKEAGINWGALSWREAREEFEKSYLAQALNECGGNISKTAEKIGLDRTNLQDKVKKYGLKGTA